MVTRYSVGGRPPVLPLKAARPAIRTASLISIPAIGMALPWESQDSNLDRAPGFHTSPHSGPIATLRVAWLATVVDLAIPLLQLLRHQALVQLAKPVEAGRRFELLAFGI